MAPPATTVQIVPPGKLVYGMQLPIVAQSTLFAAPGEAEARTTELRRIAAACGRRLLRRARPARRRGDRSPRRGAHGRVPRPRRAHLDGARPRPPPSARAATPAADLGRRFDPGRPPARGRARRRLAAAGDAARRAPRADRLPARPPRPRAGRSADRD